MKKKQTNPKIDPLKVSRRRYPHRHRDGDQSLQLVFYSNYAGRLVLGGGLSSYWNTEVYPIESIKEFEQVSIAWKHLLARFLKQGAKNEREKFSLQIFHKLLKYNFYFF